MNILKKYKSFFILLFVVVLGYWQVAFLVHALKWDNIDVVFPFRHYFSQCIQSGYFPFWNPFQQTGTPFFSDLQAPTYSPELLFISLFTKYGIYTMHFLFIAYVFVAGVGMYRLSFFFNKSNWASLLAAISYAFSGFIVGHGQHFFLLVGAAWLPFVIKSYLVLSQDKSILNVLKTAVYVFLMVSTAYQALSIILAYLLLLLFVYFLFTYIKQKNYKSAWQFLRANIYLFLLVIAFSLPLLLSTFEILPFVQRFEQGVDAFRSFNAGQSFASLKSFLLPFSTIKQEAAALRINFSLRNHYFGIITFVFFVSGLFRKRSFLEYLILGFGLLIFSSSFHGLPVRQFMFQHIPFMNLFLDASYTRVFGIFAFILIAANSMADYDKTKLKERRKLLILSFVFITIICMSLFYGGGSSGDSIKTLLAEHSILELLNHRELHQHLPVQEIIQLIVLLIFTMLVFWHRRIKDVLSFILLLSTFELVVATQLNMSTSVTDVLHKPIEMKQGLALYPQNFSIPINSKIIFNKKDFMKIQGFGRNSSIFSKDVSFQSFSSFHLKTYKELTDNNKNLRDATLNNHLFYFSDSIFSLNHFSDESINVNTDNKKLFLNEEDFLKLKHKKVATDAKDELKILEFLPNKVVVETTTSNNQFLTFLQTNFRGWQAYIDNELTPIYTSNFNYRTLFLPKGKHTISYVYKNNTIVILYFISNFLFLLTVLFLIGYSLRKRNSKIKYYIYIPLALFLLLVSLSFRILITQNENIPVKQVYEQKWGEKENTLFSFNKVNTKSRNGDNLFIFKPNNEYFTVITLNNYNEEIKEGTLVVRAKFLPKTYTPVLVVSDIKGPNQHKKWHSASFSNQTEKLNEWNDLIYFRNFHKLEKKDTLGVYLWNLNEQDFAIKDISVKVYPFEK